MPRLEEAMKDAPGGDTRGGDAKNRYIPRFPNGETQLHQQLLCELRRVLTLGSKTFQYQEEKRTIVIS
jgi:hypothetical protein